MARRQGPVGPIGVEVIAPQAPVAVLTSVKVLTPTQEAGAPVRVAPVGIRAAAPSAPRVIGDVREGRRLEEATVVREVTTAARRVGGGPSLRRDDAPRGLAPVASGMGHGGLAPALRAGVERAEPVPGSVRPTPVAGIGGKRVAPAPRASELPRRAAAAIGPATVGAVRRRVRPTGPRGLLVAAQPALARALTTGLPVGAGASRGRGLTGATRPSLAAIHTAACGVALVGPVAAAVATPGVTGALAAPVVMEMADAIRVVPPKDIPRFRASVPARAATRVRPAITLLEEANEVRADLEQEMVEAGTNGGVPDTRRSPASAACAGCTPIGRP